MTNRTSLVAMAILAAACACAELPVIESGVCGNAVPDENEDCDTFVDPALGPGTACAPPTDAERACHYTCTGSDSCPTGWGCGPDGICRSASGFFLEAPDSPMAMEADRVEVGDFDGDGRPDVLGLAGPSIELRFAGEDGRFPVDFDTSTETPLGAAAVGDLDDDGRRDVILPLLTGLFVMLGQAERSLAPVAYAPFELPIISGGVQILPLRVSETSPFDTLVLMINNCMLIFDEGVDEDCAQGGVILPNSPGGGGFLVRDVAGRIPAADVGGTAAEEIALAFTGARVVFVFRPQCTGLNPCAPKLQLIDTVNLPGLQTVLFGARFADVNGDGRLDLMVSTGTVDDDRVAVAFGDGFGNFSDAIMDDVFLQLGVAGADGFVSQRWPLAAGDFNGDGVADYISQNAIYLRFGGLLFPTGARTRPEPWVEAEVADFNRDGLADIAAAAENVEGIDFRIGDGTGLFNPSRVDTDGPPFNLRSGDFDGDLVPDLAISEADPLLGRGNDSVSILYGRLQGPPEEPVSMGRLQRIEFMEPMRTVTSVDNLDAIDDLAVQSQESLELPENRSVALMLGSSQRRLISPFSLQPSGGETESPFMVLAGRFELSDTIPDMVAIAAKHAWLVKGAGGAGFNAADAAFQDLSAVFGGVGGNLLFNPQCAIWTVVDLDGDGFDEVVGLDQAPGCNAADGAGASGATPRLLVVKPDAGLDDATFAEVPDGFTRPVETRVADLNEDGHPDLVAVFQGDPRADNAGPGGGVVFEHAGVLVFWGDGDGLPVAGASPVPALPGATAHFSAAPINADADTRLELAVATDAGVFITNFDDAGQFLAPPESPVIFVAGRSLHAADIDGDGLGDLVMSDSRGSQVYVFLAEPNGQAVVQPTPEPMP